MQSNIQKCNILVIVKIGMISLLFVTLMHVIIQLCQFVIFNILFSADIFYGISGKDIVNRSMQLFLLSCFDFVYLTYTTGESVGRHFDPHIWNTSTTLASTKEIISSTYDNFFIGLKTIQNSRNMSIKMLRTRKPMTDLAEKYMKMCHLFIPYMNCLEN